MSIIDSDKGTLNTKLWSKVKGYDDYYTLKPEIKTLIVEPLYDKLKELKIPYKLISGVYVVGSNASTHFRNDSDVDVNLVIDAIPLVDMIDLITELIKINGKKIPGTEHEINYYVTTTDHQMNLPQSYDITNGEWVSNEKIKTVDVELYKNYAKRKLHDVNNMIFELESNIIDYRDLIYLADNKADLNDKVQAKIKEIEQDMREIKEEYRTLRLKRLTGFSDENYNNIVYKLLEKYNLLRKMLKVKALLSDGFQVTDIDKYSEQLKLKKNVAYYKTIIEQLKARLL